MSGSVYYHPLDNFLTIPYAIKYDTVMHDITSSDSLTKSIFAMCLSLLLGIHNDCIYVLHTIEVSLFHMYMYT
jgi:hypothetical protein